MALARRTSFSTTPHPAAPRRVWRGSGATRGLPPSRPAWRSRCGRRRHGSARRVSQLLVSRVAGALLDHGSPCRRRSRAPAVRAASPARLLQRPIVLRRPVTLIGRHHRGGKDRPHHHHGQQVNLRRHVMARDRHLRHPRGERRLKTCASRAPSDAHRHSQSSVQLHRCESRSSSAHLPGDRW